MRVAISADVYCQSFEDEAVLLDMASGTYLGLDAMGSYLWHLLEKLGETEAVVAATLEQYDVDEETLSRDLHEWLGELRRRGLVTLEAEGVD